MDRVEVPTVLAPRSRGSSHGMTGKEVVLRAVDFDRPPRLPLARGPRADIAHIGYRPAAQFAPGREGMDEWGCVWRSLRPDRGDRGQVVEHPLEDWGRVGSYSFPEPFAVGRFAQVQERTAALRKQGKFIVGSLGSGPMHLLDYLRGFENYLVDLVQNPKRVEALLDGIFAFLLGITERFGEYGLDAVLLTDDQAAQSGMLFSMPLWRRHFGPRYRALAGCAHSAGMKFYMHTCGDLSDVLVDLLECGVDIVDNKQPALWMDSPQVDEVRGKLCFSSCIDIQTTIHQIDEGEVGPEVSRLVRRLSVPEGGFIATAYSKPDLGLPGHLVGAMWEEFERFRWE